MAQENHRRPATPSRPAHPSTTTVRPRPKHRRATRLFRYYRLRRQPQNTCVRHTGSRRHHSHPERRQRLTASWSARTIDRSHHHDVRESPPSATASRLAHLSTTTGASGTPEHRNTRTPEHQNTRTPEHRNTGTPESNTAAPIQQVTTTAIEHLRPVRRISKRPNRPRTTPAAHCVMPIGVPVSATCPRPTRWRVLGGSGSTVSSDPGRSGTGIPPSICAQLTTSRCIYRYELVTEVVGCSLGGNQVLRGHITDFNELRLSDSFLHYAPYILR